MFGTLNRTTLVVAALTVSLSAQMSGNYTVNRATTGPRNYTDLNALTHDLAVQGVNGPVSVNIAGGIYAVHWQIASIPGASSTNTVTFRSVALGSVVFNTPQTNYAMIEGVGWGSNWPIEWLKFDSLVFRSSSTGNLPRAIVFSGNCKNIEIRNCNFQKVRVIIAGNSKVNYVNGGHDIHHNKFDQTHLELLEVDGLDFHHNQYDCQGPTPIEVRSARNGIQQLRIWNNQFRGDMANASKAFLMAPNVRSAVVVHNSFFIQDGGSGNCIQVGGVFGRQSEVSNNLFVNYGVSPTVLFYSSSSFEMLCDYNLYFRKGGTAPIQLDPPGGLPTQSLTLAQWQTQSGQGANSISGDANYRSTTSPSFDLHIDASSPGNAAAGPRHSFVVDDYEDNLRYSQTAMGAFEGVLPITFTRFGNGCKGSGGWVPTIRASGDLGIGSKTLAINLALARGGPGITATLLIGASNKSFAGLPLPFPIGGGCDLLVSPDVLNTVPMQGATGFATGYAYVPFPIPNDPRLVGARLYFQWMVTDQVQGGTGLVFTEGGELAL